MAKNKGIYKQKNSRFYWIRYADITGRIIRESTKTDDFKKATVILTAKKNAVNEGKEPEIVKKRIPNYTFNDLVAEYKKWAERQRSFDSKSYLINQLKDSFGNLQLRRFTPMLLEQYQTERLQKSYKPKNGKPDTGYKPATVNRLIATLKHMFTKATDWEMVDEGVLKKIGKVKLLPENNRRLRYLIKEECGELINSCEGHLKPIVITALNTGMRKREILNLKWDNVDLKHGFILLDKTKNGHRREIPINQDLRNVLETMYHGTGGKLRRIDIPHIFYYHKSGKPYKDVKRSFATACRKAGIKDFKFHDLRHTFASHLVMAGVDITTVSRLLGHQSLTMTLRYAHLAPNHLSNAVNVLSFTAEQKPTAYLLHRKAGNQ
ncbi:MAG: tyrosine-type recombinase/integrase [Planctomycetota bacterium]|jgi:integrase